MYFITVIIVIIQAVMASDFAMGRFYFLEKLLLVHGHWSYSRLARMMLYFFYKNIVSRRGVTDLVYCVGVTLLTYLSVSYSQSALVALLSRD